MEIGAELTTGLTLLSAALDAPGVDLAAILEQLAADAARAVPSFLGLSLTITGGPSPVIFHAIDADDACTIATSLLLPLLSESGADGRTVCLVLYAATAGALVDLAADLEWLTGIGTFVLDQHLVLPVGGDAVEALHAESLVNQAVGVLIADGHTPETAHRRLAELAAAAGQPRHVAASALLNQATDGADGADDQSQR